MDLDMLTDMLICIKKKRKEVSREILKISVAEQF